MVSVTCVDQTGVAPPGPEFTSIDLHTKAGTKGPLFKAIAGEFGSEHLLPTALQPRGGFQASEKEPPPPLSSNSPACESGVEHQAPHLPPAPSDRRVHTGRARQV